MVDDERPPRGDPPATAGELANLAAANAAFEALFNDLREAKRLFETGDRSDREGTIHALESVVKFLGRFQPVLDEGLHAPLATLLDGLLGLDDGAVAPFLKPIPHPGRPRAGALRESIIGAAVFAVDRLCAAGMPTRQAEEFVAEVLTAGGVTAARGRYPEITPDTVRTWSDNVRTDVELKGEAAKIYKAFQDEQLSPPLGTDAELVKKFFRDQFTRIIRATRSNS
jgi:hypothetical protein